MILNLCLSNMYLTEQSQSHVFKCNLVLLEFLLEVVLQAFRVYVELLNITRGFKPKENGKKNVSQKWQLRNWTTSQFFMSVVCLRTE